MVTDYLAGKNPLERECHCSELKRVFRKYDQMGIGPLDIALWDHAGKRYEAPIHDYSGRIASAFRRTPRPTTATRTGA